MVVGSMVREAYRDCEGHIPLKTTRSRPQGLYQSRLRGTGKILAHLMSTIEVERL